MVTMDSQFAHKYFDLTIPTVYLLIFELYGFKFVSDLVLALKQPYHGGNYNLLNTMMFRSSVFIALGHSNSPVHIELSPHPFLLDG